MFILLFFKVLSVSYVFFFEFCLINLLRLKITQTDYVSFHLKANIVARFVCTLYHCKNKQTNFIQFL